MQSMRAERQVPRQVGSMPQRVEELLAIVEEEFGCTVYRFPRDR